MQLNMACFDVINVKSGTACLGSPYFNINLWQIGKSVKIDLILVDLVSEI